MKFVEVSVGINHNVDELLAGILTQIRLKREHNMQLVSYSALNCPSTSNIITVFTQGSRDGHGSAHWYKSRSVVRASMKARQMLTWILGKEDSKFKNCENLQVL